MHSSTILPPYSAIKPSHGFIALIIAVLIHISIFASYNDPFKKVDGAKNKGIQGIHIGLKKIRPKAATKQLTSPSVTPKKSVNKIPTPTKEPAVKKPYEKKNSQTLPKKSTRKNQPPSNVIAKPVEPILAKTPSIDTTMEPARENTAPTSKTAQNANKQYKPKADYSANHADSTLGGGDASAKISYTKTLLVWLEQHKRYPSSAKRRGQEGLIKVQFTIDKNGTVLSYRLSKPSRYNKLNKSVEKMIQAASPLPKVPSGMYPSTKTQFTFTVPIVFRLH